MSVSPDTPSEDLRAELLADGAVPHARMSDLSQYMTAHFDELQALRDEGFSWEAITRSLCKRGLVDRTGQPVSATLSKLTWSRTRKRRHAKQAAPKGAAPTTTAREPTPRPVLPAVHAEKNLARLEKNSLPFSESEWPQLDFQPVRLRSSAEPPDFDTNPPASSTPSLLSDAEVERRLAELAERQDGQKIPLPRPL